MSRLAAVLAVSIVGAFATAVTPTQHDFGRWAVGAASPPVNFRVTLPAGSTFTDSIDLSIAGADAADFTLSNAVRRGANMRIECSQQSRAGACDVPVEFWANSIGPKAARLEVKDKTGTIATATLRGIGIAPLCTTTVVSCNYAHLYSGSFSWQSDLNGQYGQNRRSVTVTVVNGVATCSGSETDVIIDTQGYRTSHVGSISGPGLIGIEFVEDTQLGLAYRIVGACPSPQWPASLGRTSQPAGSGSTYYEESYKQKATVAGQAALRGSRNVAHPDTDAANGVTGTMSVSWAFTRS